MPFVIDSMLGYLWCGLEGGLCIVHQNPIAIAELPTCLLDRCFDVLLLLNGERHFIWVDLTLSLEAAVFPTSNLVGYKIWAIVT